MHKTNMNFLGNLRWKKDQNRASMTSIEPGKVDAHNVVDDDPTELLASFSSLCNMSSSTTINEHSSSSMSVVTSMRDHEVLASYMLQKNVDGSFGYIQLQVQVSGLEDVPKELAMVSGKPIFYIMTDPIHGINVEAELDAFSHPLLVEALESLFIPVLITPKKDRPLEIKGFTCLEESELHAFAVGFLDEVGSDLVPPLSYDDLSSIAIVEAIVAALTAKQQAIPKYVDLLAEEMRGITSVTNRRARFGLDGVASPELAFAGLEGVLATRVGSLHGQFEKVVEVVYDFKRLTFSALARFAIAKVPCETTTIFCQSNDECMAARLEAVKLGKLEGMTTDLQVFIEYVGFCTFEPFIDLSALRQTPMRFVPLTELQSSKANSLIHDGRFNDATRLLSPRQVLILKEATRKGATDFPEASGFPILDAWIRVSDVKSAKSSRT